MVWTLERPGTDMAAKRDRSAAEPEYREIGRRLRAHREAQHRTQLEMAVELGIAEGTYGRREAGLIRFPFPDLQRVAHVLGLTLADLMPDAPMPAPPTPRPPSVLLRELEASIAAGELSDPALRGLLVEMNQLPPERGDELKRMIREWLDDKPRTNG